jgi:hypothetical protein
MAEAMQDAGIEISMIVALRSVELRASSLSFVGLCDDWI